MERAQRSRAHCIIQYEPRAANSGLAFAKFLNYRTAAPRERSRMAATFINGILPRVTKRIAPSRLADRFTRGEYLNPSYSLPVYDEYEYE